MPLSKAVFVALLVFVSVPLWCQNLHESEDAVFTRLSFDSSPKDDLPTHMCLSVSQNGHYRMLRNPAFGDTEMVEGTMSEGQLRQLRAFLANPEFEKLNANAGGGIVRGRWQNFGAEVFRDNHRQRVRWLVAEDTGPFPESIRALVDWLADFEPAHSKPFSYTEFPDVCPSGGIRPVQPTIASK